VAINIPEVLVHLRGKVVDSHRGGVPGVLQATMSGASWLLAQGSRLAVAQKAAGLSSLVLGRHGRIGRMPAPLSRWTDARDLPAPPRESFRAWWLRTDGGHNNEPDQPGKPPIRRITRRTRKSQR
jgi:L-lactate dehydrogenase complex protein LldF